MRISDWSSDVCSSDLSLRRERPSLAEMLCVTARSGIVSREETGEPEPLVQGPEIGGPSQNIVARVVGVIAEAVLGAGAEERRVGEGGVSTCRFRWSPYH